MIEYRLRQKILHLLDQNGLSLEPIDSEKWAPIRHDIKVYVDIIAFEPKSKHDILCKAGAYLLAKKHGYQLSLKSILGHYRIRSYNLLVVTDPLFNHPVFQDDSKIPLIDRYYMLLTEKFQFSPELIQEARLFLPKLSTIKSPNQAGVSVMAALLSQGNPLGIRGYQIADCLQVSRGSIYRNLTSFFPTLLRNHPWNYSQD